MKPLKVPSRDEIIQCAKYTDGFYTVNRYSYRHEKLRKKLKAMAKDKKCLLHFYAATKDQIIYSI